MASFNKVVLMGNLVRDPELRYTPKGTAVCKFGIAVNRTWTNEAGEKKEEVTFIDIDAFGRTAENIGQYMRKGKPILVEGRLKLDQWDDKQTGQKKTKLGVILESFQFVGSKDDGDGAAPATNQGQQSSRQQRPAASAPVEGDAPPESDDVPF